MNVASFVKTGCAVLALVLSTTLAAQAGTLTAVPQPGITLSFTDLAGSISGVDVRGTDFLTDSTATHFAYLTDFGTPGSPNTSLFASDLGITQAVAILFDIPHLSFSADFQEAFLTGLAIRVSPTVTDPILKALLGGGGVGTYGFNLASATPIGDGASLITYNLTVVEVAASAVPEPSTFAFLLVGLAGGVCALRRRLGNAGQHAA